MKPKSTLPHLLALAGSSLLAISSSNAQATYTWANSNVTGATPPASLNWINPTQGTWIGGTPVSGNLNTIQFFENTSTALLNTGGSGNTQESVLDSGSTFQLGTLTLSGLASATANANLTMNLSGDALNFSAATGRINLDALNATRTITYNVANNIQLGTASSGSVLNIAGNGNSAFNLNGAISELQAGGGSLVKTGTSTVSLTAANTFTGATTINGGNVTLSGASGSLASTSINLISGGLTLNNSSTTGNSGTRISDSATITVTGNTALTFSHNGASGVDYSETIGTLSLQSGSLTYTGSQANATGPRSSNVLFNTLNRIGTATANFAGSGLGTNVRNTIQFGSGVTANADLGPWAVVNGTDFAYYDATNGVVATTSSTLTSSSNSATTNFNSNGGNITFDASPTSRSLKTLLINSTTARTVSLNGNTVSVGGISAAATTNIVHTINGAGALQTLNAGDALYINMGTTGNNSWLQIDSNIQNYNGGATGSSLVKYGAGRVDVIGLVNISGGIVVNAGILNLTNASNSITGGFSLNGGSLGGNTGLSTSTLNNNNITVNGTSFLGMLTTSETNGTITLNANSNLSVGNNNGTSTIHGAVTGSGSLSIDRLGLGSTTINLNSTVNTFTGNISFTGAGVRTLNVTSLTDTNALGAGNIRFLGSDTHTFAWNSASTPLTLNNRQFEIVAGSTGTPTISNSSTQAFTVNTDLIVGATGTRTMGLGGSGTGIGSFNGLIANGSASSLGLTKTGTGTWVLGNAANSYSGVTTLAAGSLSVSKMADYGTVSSLGTGGASGTAIAFTGGNLLYTGTGDDTNRVIAASAGNAAITNNGTGALNFTATGNFNVAGSTTSARRVFLGGTNGGTISGAIVNNTGTGAAFGVSKFGSGTWTLGAQNSYTGLTDIQGGTLQFQSGASNIAQTLGGLQNQYTEGTLISNMAGTGSLSTTFNAYTRSNSGTGNIVTTGGTYGTNHSVIITGTAGFIDRGLFFNGSEYAARSGTGLVRALNYATTGGDTDTVDVNTVTASKHVKLTSSYSGAGVTLLSLNLQGSAVGWDNSSGNLTVPGIIKSGGGSQSTISGGSLLTASNAELVIRTDTSSDSLLITSVVNSGSGQVTKSGAGTLTLSGTNTYNGQTNINAGTLSISSNANLGSQTTGAALNIKGGTLQVTADVGLFNGTAGTNNRNVTLLNQSNIEVTGTNTLTIAGAVSNNAGVGGGFGGFNKTGTGTLELSGTNTYTGPTNVNAGTLLINGSTSSTSLVTVNNGGTLGGTGTIGGSVTLNSGSTLSPGASIESLATGSNVWNGGSTFVFEFSTNGSTGAAGTEWDLLGINGSLDLSGASVLNPISFDLVSMANATTSGALGSWNPNADALWAGFVTTTGGITNFAANLFNIDTTGFQNTINGSFSIAKSGNNLDLIYTAIPEPRAALLGGLGLLALLRRRRA